METKRESAPNFSILRRTISNQLGGTFKFIKVSQAKEEIRSAKEPVIWTSWAPSPTPRNASIVGTSLSI
jgi:hypothetical protein